MKILTRPFKGLISMGAHGAQRDFTRVAVYPPDRNDMILVSFTGEEKSRIVSLTTTRLSALRLARTILDTIPASPTIEELIAEENSS